MSRCVICDFCDTTGVTDYLKEMKWDENILGFVCLECSIEISESLSEFEDEEETLDELG